MHKKWCWQWQLKQFMCIFKQHIICLGLTCISLCFSDLVVASPVEDYFLYIDDLPYPEKVRIHIFLLTFCQAECSNVIFPCYSWQKEAEEITRPFLDALGDDYSVCCQGMMFFSSFFVLCVESLVCQLSFSALSFLLLDYLFGVV